MALIIAVTVLGAVGVLVIGMLVQNERVHAFRRGYIDRVYAAGRADMARGIADPSWRWEEFDRVPYARMVWQFWRPLASFYPDKRFLEPRPYEASDG